MEGKKYNVVEGLDELPPLSDLVAVALSGGKKDKYTVKWALEKFVPEQQMHFKLIHVRPKISRIPTPMGNYIPMSGVRDDVAAAYRKDIESQVNEKLLPYKKICSQKKVRAEIEQIESDDVVSAISAAIRQHLINKLVIGVSSRPFFSRFAVNKLVRGEFLKSNKIRSRFAISTATVWFACAQLFVVWYQLLKHVSQAISNPKTYFGANYALK